VLRWLLRVLVAATFAVVAVDDYEARQIGG
jgi:predicted outer membrane lipoprotein